MKGEEILAKFKEKMNKTPKADLSTKEGYYDFCERLSKKTYPEMIAKDMLRADSMALAGSKLFG